MARERVLLKDSPYRRFTRSQPTVEALHSIGHERVARMNPEMLSKRLMDINPRLARNTDRLGEMIGHIDNTIRKQFEPKTREAQEYQEAMAERMQQEKAIQDRWKVLDKERAQRVEQQSGGQGFAGLTNAERRLREEPAKAIQARRQAVMDQRQARLAQEEAMMRGEKPKGFAAVAGKERGWQVGRFFEGQKKKLNPDQALMMQKKIEELQTKDKLLKYRLAEELGNRHTAWKNRMTPGKLGRGLGRGLGIGAIGVAGAAVATVKGGHKVVKAGTKVGETVSNRPLMQVVFFWGVIYQFLRWQIFRANGIDSMMQISLGIDAVMFVILAMMAGGSDRSLIDRILISLPTLAIWFTLMRALSYFKGLSLLEFTAVSDNIPWITLAIAIPISIIINRIAVKDVSFGEYRAHFKSIIGVFIVMLLNSGLQMRIGGWIARGQGFDMMPEALYLFNPFHWLFFWMTAWWCVYALIASHEEIFKHANFVRSLWFMVFSVLLVINLVTPTYAEAGTVTILGDGSTQRDLDYITEEGQGEHRTYWGDVRTCLTDTITFKGMGSCSEIGKAEETEEERLNQLRGGIAKNKERAVTIDLRPGRDQTVFSHDLIIPMNAKMIATTLRGFLNIDMECGMQDEEAEDKFTIMSGTGIMEPKTIKVSMMEKTGHLETVSCSLTPHELEQGTSRMVFRASFQNDVSSEMWQFFMLDEHLQTLQNEALDDIEISDRYFSLLADPKFKENAKAWLQFTMFPTVLAGKYDGLIFESKSDPDFVKLIIETEGYPVFGLRPEGRIAISAALESTDKFGRITKLKKGRVEVPEWLEPSESCNLMSTSEPGVWAFKNEILGRKPSLKADSQILLFSCKFRITEPNPEMIYPLPNEVYPEQIRVTLTYDYEVNSFGYLKIIESDLREVYLGEAIPNEAQGDRDLQIRIIDAAMSSPGNRKGQGVPASMMLGMAWVYNNGHVSKSGTTYEPGWIGLMGIPPNLAQEKCPDYSLTELEEDDNFNTECAAKILTHLYDTYYQGHELKGEKCGFSQYKDWHAALAAWIGWQCDKKNYVEQVSNAQQYFAVVEEPVEET
ncbi:MAG: hypothetical protein KJ709_07435 [Nanoarchaeota archaeon]|nr:hypothetical protein [Nanoarchaeota archaeon]